MQKSSPLSPTPASKERKREHWPLPLAPPPLVFSKKRGKGGGGEKRKEGGNSREIFRHAGRDRKRKEKGGSSLVLYYYALHTPPFFSSVAGEFLCVSSFLSPSPLPLSATCFLNASPVPFRRRSQRPKLEQLLLVSLFVLRFSHENLSKRLRALNQACQRQSTIPTGQKLAKILRRVLLRWLSILPALFALTQPSKTEKRPRNKKKGLGYITPRSLARSLAPFAFHCCRWHFLVSF